MRKDQYLLFECPKTANILSGLTNSNDQQEAFRRFARAFELANKSHLEGVIYLTRYYKFITPMLKPTSESKVFMKTPYFNPKKLPDDVPVYILSSAIETNGFFCGHGLSRLIPFVYEAFQNTAIRKSLLVSMAHYIRKTYHSKGTHIQMNPKFHVISCGSSNYNIRSDVRDEEIHFVIFNPKPDLIQYLHSVYAQINNRSFILQQYPLILRDHCYRGSLASLEKYFSFPSYDLLSKRPLTRNNLLR